MAFAGADLDTVEAFARERLIATTGSRVSAITDQPKAKEIRSNDAPVGRLVIDGIAAKARWRFSRLESLIRTVSPLEAPRRGKHPRTGLTSKALNWISPLDILATHATFMPCKFDRVCLQV
jgi:hypothetical protein